MKYLIGEEFVLDVPVKVVGVELKSLGTEDFVQYALDGTMPDGTELRAHLWEPVKKKEEATCKK